KAELQADLESKTAELETLHEEVSAREEPVNTPANETVVETSVPEIDEQGINAIDTGIADEAGPGETGNAGESAPADTETIIEQPDAPKSPLAEVPVENAVKTPRTVRELANIEAEEHSGFMSGALLSALEYGKEFSVGGKIYTVTKKTKPKQVEYSN